MQHLKKKNLINAESDREGEREEWGVMVFSRKTANGIIMMGKILQDKALKKNRFQIF